MPRKTAFGLCVPGNLPPCPQPALPAAKIKACHQQLCRHRPRAVVCPFPFFAPAARPVSTSARSSPASRVRAPSARRSSRFPRADRGGQDSAPEFGGRRQGRQGAPGSQADRARPDQALGRGDRGDRRRDHPDAGRGIHDAAHAGREQNYRCRRGTRDRVARTGAGRYTRSWPTTRRSVSWSCALPLLPALCGWAYALLWAVYWPFTAYGIISGEIWQWVFVIPVFVAAGSGISFATLDLDFGNAAMHYCFFLLVTILLRFAIGMPQLWELQGGGPVPCF